jgi:hypothetical protein
LIEGNLRGYDSSTVGEKREKIKNKEREKKKQIKG